MEKIVFEYHYHEDDGKTRTQAKREIKKTLSRFTRWQYSQECVEFSDLLDLWLQRALTMSSTERKRLRDIEKVKIYSMKHLERGATQIKEDSGVSLSSRSICNMRHAAKKKAGYQPPSEIFSKSGSTIFYAVTGMRFSFLACQLRFRSCQRLQCSTGTERSPAQSRHFHNFISFMRSWPMTRRTRCCIVFSKEKQSIYKRLLRLVETMANARHMTIFNRAVRFMVDFERAFINAIQDYEAGNGIVCCQFHFTKNVRKRANQSIEEIKNRFGKTSKEARLSERIKRMFMMLPFVPESLIVPETVDTIIGFWEREFPGTTGVFDSFRDFILKVYVGQTASYKPNIWSVSGMRIRTNNAAESLNGRVN